MIKNCVDVKEFFIDISLEYNNSFFPERFKLLFKDSLKSKVFNIAQKGNYSEILTLMKSSLLDFLELRDIKELLKEQSNSLLRCAFILDSYLIRERSKFIFSFYEVIENNPFYIKKF